MFASKTTDVSEEEAGSNNGFESEDELDCKSSDLVDDLRNLASECNLTIEVLNRILQMLRKHFPDIPADARTILKCPSIMRNMKKFSDGSFAYFGMKYALDVCLKHNPNLVSRTLYLYFNIDGIPLTKSSHKQFWPLLVKIDGTSQPSALAIFCGNSKPNFNDFFSDFVSEINEVLINGITLNEKYYRIKIKGFLCDAPAKAAVKFIKPFNAYDGCDYCETVGSYEGRVIFDEIDALERTDQRFDNYDDHLVGDSPLKQIIGLGMITNFPLDYMHVVALGVTKKLIYLWLSGPLKVRIGSSCVSAISERLMKIANAFPSDFARKPRSLKSVGLWKASEFRTFLLYTGPVVLLSVLPDNLYQHFLLFSVAIRLLLSSEMVNQYRAVSKHMLREFVSDVPRLYDKNVMTYNVHSLIHLSDQTDYHGCLDRFSCFDFESYLGYLKKLVRAHKNELLEVSNKLSIKNSFAIPREKERRIFSFKHTDGPLQGANGFQYRSLILDNIRFSSYFYNERDSYVYDDMNVYSIYNIVRNGENVNFVCKKFKRKRRFFEEPIESDVIDIYVVEFLSTVYEILPLANVICKGVLLPFRSSHVFIPIIDSCKK